MNKRDKVKEAETAKRAADALKAKKHGKDKWWIIDQAAGTVKRTEEPKGEDRKSALRARGPSETIARAKIVAKAVA